MASPTPAPTRGSPASRSSDPIPHPTSATPIDTTVPPTTISTTDINPPPDTPTSRYSAASRASSSSSSGLDYYSHNSPPPLSSQIYDHQHSSSISGQDHDLSYDQPQVPVSLHRKPVPSPLQDQHASPVIDPVHLSSPLSIKNKPPPIPQSTVGSISPSSVEGSDSFTSVPRNSNRYATPLFHSPRSALIIPSIYTPSPDTARTYRIYPQFWLAYDCSTFHFFVTKQKKSHNC